MKTAAHYLRDAIGYEPTSSRIDYTDALAAVQAVLDEAASTRTLMRQALDDYFGFEAPAEAAPAPEPAPIRLGGRGPFPPACPRCLQRGADCLCPPPSREEPPF